MRLTLILLPVLSLLSSAVLADDDGTGSPPNTHLVTLHKWPLSLASPIPLGTVGYNPQTKTGDYKVAKAVGDVLGGDDEVVRVGVWDGKESWFGCVTAGVSCLFGPTLWPPNRGFFFIYPSRRIPLLTERSCTGFIKRPLYSGCDTETRRGWGRLAR